MADIFVSYSRQDRSRVAPLIALLEGQGWTVWWDREINPGQSFDELIEQELDQARAIVVVWSRHSVNSRWVRNEALEASDRGILVPVRLDDERIPVAFRQSQVADLTRWPARVDQHEIEHLLAAIAAKVGRVGVGVPELPQSRRKRRVALAAGVAALLVLALAAVQYWRDTPAASLAATTRAGLAVLQPRAASAAPEESFLGDSLADEVTALLSPVDELRVSSLTAAWELPDDLSDSEIAERLNVRYLVESTVAQTAAGTTVQVRLLDTQAQQTLLDRQFPASMADIRNLRLMIAEDVLHQLGVEQARIDAILNSADVVHNQEAFDLYLRAKALLRRSGEIETLTGASDLLLQAIQLDPGFGAAHAGLCRANLAIVRAGGALHYFESGERACYRALTFGRSDAEVQLALGELYDLSGQYAEALQAYERALERDPLLSDALIGLGHALTMLGDAERAYRAYRRATEIQPGYWRAHNGLGWFYMHQGRYLEAIDTYTQVTYLAPGNAWGFSNRGSARFATGDFAGAISDWQRSAEIDPESSALSNMGTAYFYLRDYPAALQMYDRAIAKAPADYQIWLNAGDALRFASQESDTEAPRPAADAADAYRKAIRYIQEELSINPNNAVAKSAKARALAFLGETAEANALLTEFDKSAQGHPEVLYNATLARISLGSIAEAQQTLSAAISAGYPTIYALSDPLFDSLRGSDAFMAGPDDLD